MIIPEFRNLKVDYLGYKSPPLFPDLSWMNSIHAIPSCSLKTQFYVLLPSTCKSYKQLLSVKFPYLYKVSIFILANACQYHTYLVLLDFLTLIILGEEYKTCIMQFFSSLLLHPSYNTQVPSSVTTSQIPQVYVLPVIWLSSCTSTWNNKQIYRT